LTEALLQSQAKRIILDADALNVFEGRAEALRETEAELVLTPHPGEAARLLGCEAREVQSDREAALLKLVERTGATVVLKGAGTLVGAPRHGIHRIQAGNPGMATGGSGDVLAGLLTGLWAQGMAAFDAARLAVWRHATAGDLAAWRGSETTLLAGDIIDAL
jgi:NAD(P)H-hydrate epimerase